MTQSLLFDSELPKPIDLPGYPAAWSPCKRYRYTLWRTWTDETRPRYAQFVCLNPSTADETTDDPTVRRCIQFAKDWGFGAFCMTNLFAFRATEPADMKAADDPTGDDNDYWLARVATRAEVIVAAWGNDGAHQRRDRAVRLLFPNLQCLKLNEKTGQPAHPLYMLGSLTPKPFKTKPDGSLALTKDDPT